MPAQYWTPELTVLGLAALLQLVQIGLAAWSMHNDGLDKWNAGPRDAEPKFSPLTGRLRRAVNNHFEALAFFTIAVLLIAISGQSTGLTRAAAWVYLLSRALYVPAYAFGWTPWRSVIYGIGTLASVAMILSALF